MTEAPQIKRSHVLAVMRALLAIHCQRQLSEREVRIYVAYRTLLNEVGDE